MHKQLLCICLIFALLVIGCGSSSSSGGSNDPILPSQDLTGEYEIEVNPPDFTFPSDPGIGVCDGCRRMAHDIYSVYIDAYITIDQYGNSFDFIINGEIYTGIINPYEYIPDEYIFSNKEYITQDDTTVKIEWQAIFTPTAISENEYGFGGSFTYHILFEEDCMCEFSIRFNGYPKGSRDPIIYIDPIEYDYGTVVCGEKKTTEFTIYNANLDGLSKDLIITAKNGLEEPINMPDYIFHTEPAFILDDSILIGNHQLFTLSIVYEPSICPSDDSYTLTLITNDPDYPEINIELKGKGV